jgi:hypothetical protein
MSRYLTFATTVFVALVAQFAQADELLPKGAPRSFQRMDILEEGATIGGYPIYQGGRLWRTLAIQARANNMDIKIGSAQFISPVGDEFFAEMDLVASLSGDAQNGYFSADVCSPAKEHLVISKRAFGTMDNCLTIDPYSANIGGREIAVLAVKIRNSQSNWRLYDMTIFLNLAYLGYPDSTTADWNAAAVAGDAGKGRLIEKISGWGKQLQTSVNNAIAYSKPQDAFVSVPSISTLMVLDETTPPAKKQTSFFPSAKANVGNSYVYCESSKKMVIEGSQDCH